MNTNTDKKPESDPSKLPFHDSSPTKVMLVTGPSPDGGAHHHHGHHHHHHGHQAGGSAPGSGMGFLRAPNHHKVPSPLSESISERFSNILDNCQKKIKLLQGPSSLFNNLVT